MKRILPALLVLIFTLNSCAFADAWPLTVTDQAGREVTIEAQPETIVSGYYIATSMLIALDQEAKLLGVENDAGKRPVYALSAPHLLALPSMGTVKTFDLETCALLNPDLVVLPLRLSELAPKLEELGFACLFVNPESEDLLKESIMLLGMATGSSERAQQLINFMDEKLDALDAALQDTEKPLVYFSGNSSFLNTAGPAMYQHSLLENAGCENAAKDFSDTYWAATSYEQLLAWNPDAIIMAADAKYSRDSVLADENLICCNAIESGSVYQVPNAIESWDAPVPGSFLASLYLAARLHPEHFSMAEYEAAVTEYYESFYGFTPEF